MHGNMGYGNILEPGPGKHHTDYYFTQEENSQQEF